MKAEWFSFVVVVVVTVLLWIDERTGSLSFPPLLTIWLLFPNVPSFLGHGPVGKSSTMTSRMSSTSGAWMPGCLSSSTSATSWQRSTYNVPQVGGAALGGPIHPCLLAAAWESLSKEEVDHTLLEFLRSTWALFLRDGGEVNTSSVMYSDVYQDKWCSFFLCPLFLFLIRFARGS